MYKDKKIGAIILARMKSTRLPGKVMLSLRGKPVLQCIVERLENSDYIDKIIIATGDNVSCDPIASMCDRLGYSCFRGSEDDVLSRFVGAASFYNLDAVVRITGDCPMVDWRAVDTMIHILLHTGCDYCSNVIHRTYPIGLDAEVISTDILEEIDRLAEGVDRQHITTYIYKTHPDKYKMINLVAEDGLYYPELRVTLDTLEDYIVLHTLYELLDINFSAVDAIGLLKGMPETVQINSSVRQKHYLEG